MLSPVEFAQRMDELRAAGASIVGGCCGTEPQHLAAITNRA
jgi:methionine synthase I (cobalamin-dependent)